MLPEKQKKAFDDFYASARHNNILSARETLLIHFATSLSTGCAP
jgi:hypothetical protein